MTRKPAPSPGQSFLGIECGGTRTVALLADDAGNLLQRLETGAANLRLLSDAQLLRHFKVIAKEFPRPTAVCIGMAGARTDEDCVRIYYQSARIWPRVPCYATNDLETALVAGQMQIAECRMKNKIIAKRSPSSFFMFHFVQPCVLVLSGTGSCCFGRNPAGKIAKAGGWGHMLGDGGSGYEIGMSALREVIGEFDRSGKLPKLGQQFLRRLQLNEPDEFIAWAQAADKTEVSALAVEVFAAWNCGDRRAALILSRSAKNLVANASACARRLNPSGKRVEFVFAGSNLLKQPRFTRLVALSLKRVWPRAVITPLVRESAWGAVELAREIGGASILADRPSVATPTRGNVRPTTLSPTEQRNPRSMNLDKLPTAKAIELMLSEDAKIPAALRAERKQIERAIDWIASAFHRGGRLFYVGAGTSGRLGILDASECPPTFRTPPELVQGIIAGGQSAIWQAVEGAEDDAAAGARAIEFRGVGKRDVVVGIAASGRTPFVVGALTEAKQRGARTVLLCFNPHVRRQKDLRSHLIIAPDIGPEVLTGSTRLKAGTATKLVLNMFTTLAMVRLGKVVGNLMVDLNPSNVKLRDRAVRIVRELTGADAATARTALEKSGWVVKTAWRLI